MDKCRKASEFGPEIANVVMPEFASVKSSNDTLIGEILHVDDFGNIITNISQKEMLQTKTINVKLPNVFLNVAFGKTYAQTKPREAIALIGSHGFLEIALNQMSAAEKFHACSWRQNRGYAGLSFMFFHNFLDNINGVL